MTPGLGTQLRHLIELLDGAVEETYREAGFDYRPRYTPVMRALIAHEPATIGQIATLAGITQPAATQTVALMVKDQLVVASAGAADGRQRMIRLSERGRALAPQLQEMWQATAAAAASLDADLPTPLQPLLTAAIDALRARPFKQRIAQARTTNSTDQP